MATSRKTPAKGSTPKATPAGRKGRTSPTRKSTRGKATPEGAVDAADAAAVAPDATRAHLRAVTDSDAEATTPAAAGDDGRFKRGDLIEAVCEKTSLKRSDARIVLDLVLQELGRALDRNEDLVLPPLGKLMVKKRKPDADGPDILTVKIRRPAAGSDGAGAGAGDGGETPLADPDEDS